MERIEQIEERQASGEVAAFYEDFRASMRAAFVPTVLRSLARYPAVLLPAWQALRPGLVTVRAERAGAALRRACAAALADVGPVVRAPSLDAEARLEIVAVLRTFAYVIPKAWLVVSALREAWEGRPIDGPRDGADLGRLPRGVPEGMPDVPLLPEEPGDPAVRRVFEAARHRLGRPAVPSIYRTLGRWPAFLEAAWEPLVDPVALTAIRARLPGLVDEAVRLARTLPVSLASDRARLAPAPGGAGAGEIGGILATYARTMPETLVQILRLLRDLEGAEALVRPSPFDAA